MTAGGSPIDRYLAALPDEQRTTLSALRDTLREVLPGAEEKMAYGMPCVAVAGKQVALFMAFTHHCTYFTASGRVIAAAGALPGWCDPTTSGFRFPSGRHLPTALVRRMVRLRLKDISDVRHGKRIDFFPDGRVKATGPMRDGLLHGRWRWYRADGSLMRAGAFRSGEQTGEWLTYDRDGEVVKATRFPR